MPTWRRRSQSLKCYAAISDLKRFIGLVGFKKGRFKASSEPRQAHHCAPANGRPGFVLLGFCGAGGRFPKARRGCPDRAAADDDGHAQQPWVAAALSSPVKAGCWARWVRCLVGVVGRRRRDRLVRSRGQAGIRARARGGGASGATRRSSHGSSRTGRCAPGMNEAR